MVFISFTIILELFFYLNGNFNQELVPQEFLFNFLHIISIISFHLCCILGGSV